MQKNNTFSFITNETLWDTNRRVHDYWPILRNYKEENPDVVVFVEITKKRKKRVDQIKKKRKSNLNKIMMIILIKRNRREKKNNVNYLNEYLVVKEITLSWVFSDEFSSCPRSRHTTTTKENRRRKEQQRMFQVRYYYFFFCIFLLYVVWCSVYPFLFRLIKNLQDYKQQFFNQCVEKHTYIQKHIIK